MNSDNILEALKYLVIGKLYAIINKIYLDYITDEGTRQDKPNIYKGIIERYYK